MLYASIEKEVYLYYMYKIPGTFKPRIIILLSIRSMIIFSILSYLCHSNMTLIDFDFEVRMALTAWRSPARPFTPALALGVSSQAMPMPESSDAKAGQFNGSRDKKSLANTKASGTSGGTEGKFRSLQIT